MVRGVNKMPRELVIDVTKCTGCGSCERTCSLKNAKVFTPRARVQVERLDEEGFNIPIMCQHCADAPCVAICPSGALVKNHYNGEIKFLSNLCIGCRMCMQVCPFGAISFNKKSFQIEKCDLCEGDPYCVKVCMAGAISYADPNLLPETRRRETLVKYQQATAKEGQK